MAVLPALHHALGKGCLAFLRQLGLTLLDAVSDPAAAGLYAGAECFDVPQAGAATRSGLGLRKRWDQSDSKDKSKSKAHRAVSLSISPHVSVESLNDYAEEAKVIAADILLKIAALNINFRAAEKLSGGIKNLERGRARENQNVS